jgi:hypothetical protein
MASFDPLNLTESASLNKTTFADAGFIDAGLRGVPAYDMLSAQALRRQIAAAAPALRLDSAVASGRDLLPAFDALLAAPDEAVRSTAAELAQRFGRYLAFLILTLSDRDSKPGSEAAAYRAHWSTIRRVHLGGGIVSGRLGPAMRDAAIDVLHAAGRNDLRLDVALNAGVLPLVGAARSVSPGVKAALVCDFGSTNAKCAFALCESGALTALRLLPRAPVSLPADAGPSVRAESLASFMIETLVSAWRAGRGAGVPLGYQIGASVAAYVRDGHPIEYGADAGYYLLRRLGANASEALSQRLSDNLGDTLRVTLTHDSSTAARAVAGAERCAVIMLGTSLGVGFAPPAGDVLPLAAGFEVTRDAS